MGTANIIAIANQKGGVGKTFLTRSLAGCLAKKGQKVLCVDGDMQGDLTDQFGVDGNDLINKRITFTDLVAAELKNQISFSKGNSEKEFEYNTSDAILHISENEYLLPATRDLADVQGKLNFIPGQYYSKIVRKILSQVSNTYDFILIDCPPALSPMSISLLSACNSVLVPLFPDRQSHRALQECIRSISTIRKTYNNELKINGLIFTRVESQTVMHHAYMNAIRKVSPHYVYNTVIPKSTVAVESASARMSVLDYAPDSQIGTAVAKLGTELILRTVE